MNERTHFFIKIYISHFILEMVDVGCVWKMSWRRRQTAILTPSSSDHSSTTSSSWLGVSTASRRGPKPLCLPLALNSAYCLQLIQAVCVLVILLLNAHLLPLFFAYSHKCISEWPLGRGSICYIDISTVTREFKASFFFGLREIERSRKVR